MSNEEYKKFIVIMIEKINDNRALERIYKYVHKFFVMRTGE